MPLSNPITKDEPDVADDDQLTDDQKKTRDEELKAGKKAGGKDKSKEVAAAPAGVRGKADGATQGGFMDQMSARSGADALEGHYVTIDMSYKGVADAYEALGLEEHTGNYGVYMEVGSVRDDGTGIPETAIVRLRDSSHALVALPYEALSRAEGRGRS